jgi:hypothetical protein
MGKFAQLKRLCLPGSCSMTGRQQGPVIENISLFLKALAAGIHGASGCQSLAYQDVVLILTKYGQALDL